MTDRQVNALAAFVSEGRDDWQAPGVVAELRRQREHYDPWQLAAALVKRASDPANTTPRMQPFDRDSFVTCRRHPRSTTRTDGTCSTCYVDSHADDSGVIRDRGGRPIPPETKAAMKAVLHRPSEARSGVVL